MIDCAQSNGELVKAAEIARRLDISLQNTLKIVHVLSHAGFVTAARGRNGGVRLARPAHDIRVGDVIRATEVTSVEIEGEPATPRPRKSDSVSIGRVLDQALQAFIAVLDRHTLEDMARGAAVELRGDPSERLGTSREARRRKPKAGAPARPRT